MPILIVSAAVIVGGYLTLKWLLHEDGIWDSIRSHERRERCQGWTDGPYWPLERERAQKERA